VRDGLQRAVVAARAPVVRHEDALPPVQGTTGYLDRHQVARGPAAAGRERGDHHAGEPARAPHTKISRAPAASRRKRGVDMTPASRASTWAAVTGIVSTDAEHA